MPIEIELKLAIAVRDIPRLRRHPLLRGTKAVRRKLYGIYFDTPDAALYRRRSAFRLRREGYHWVQTLKVDAPTQGALSARPEWEVRVTGNRPDFAVLPAEALAHLDADIMQRLQPAFSTDIQRTTWQLERPEGVIEVALDQGHIRAGERDLPVAEVELELKAGDGAILFDAALALLEVVPLVAEYRSKALRGYQLAGIAKAAPCKSIDAGIDPHVPGEEAWRRMLLAGMGQLSHNLPGFLAGDDPEYLHQMRVAVRRMRTVMSLGKDLVRVPESWTTDLKWLMAELSPARDWDVLVAETLAGVAAQLPQPERLDVLAAAARQRQQAANARAREAVASPRLTALLLRMGRDLLKERPEGPQLAQWARSALDKRLRRFKRLAKDFARLDAAGRHQLRIAAKRLRYAGEAFALLHGGKAERYLDRVARLQDGLGVANDIAVAHGLLTELAAATRDGLAAGLVEGYWVSEGRHRLPRVGALVEEIIAARPFWR